LPQWNCSCDNCLQARQGAIHPRTQSSVALSADGQRWFLINASPDLRAQIEAFSGLQPSPDTPRNTPIEGVLLTNADLDHVLGLFLLRESSQLHIHAPKPVFEVLHNDLRLIDTLKPFCRVDHHEPPTEKLAPLVMLGGQDSGLLYRAIPLSTKPPPFAVVTEAKGIQSVAYEIVDEETKGRLVVAPDVAKITPALLEAMQAADAILFDGTFWSNREFEKLTGKKRTASDMGHVPIQTGSLKVLRNLKARHKIYFHINNTNPILRPDSPERIKVARAGLSVSADGMELEL
jgi:pyrroloquinoline quinone biosynthesis protein B